MLGSCRRLETSRWRGSPFPPLPLPRFRRPRHAFCSSPLEPASTSPPSTGARRRLRVLTSSSSVSVVVGGLVVLVGLEQVGGVQEGALLEPDVDERGLYSGEDGVDATEVDVADGTAMIGTVDQQLDQTIILEDGHARFALAPVDQDLALHERTSAAPTRLPPARPGPGKQGTACARLVGAGPLTGGTAPSTGPAATNGIGAAT